MVSYLAVLIVQLVGNSGRVGIRIACLYTCVYELMLCKCDISHKIHKGYGRLTSLGPRLLEAQYLSMHPSSLIQYRRMGGGGTRKLTSEYGM